MHGGCSTRQSSPWGNDQSSNTESNKNRGKKLKNSDPSNNCLAFNPLPSRKFAGSFKSNIQVFCVLEWGTFCLRMVLATRPEQKVKKKISQGHAMRGLTLLKRFLQIKITFIPPEALEFWFFSHQHSNNQE